jgi:hypothetical protein
MCAQDALAVTFVCEPATLPVWDWEGPGDHLVRSEYNPFANDWMRDSGMQAAGVNTCAAVLCPRLGEAAGLGLLVGNVSGRWARASAFRMVPSGRSLPNLMLHREGKVCKLTSFEPA